MKKQKIELVKNPDGVFRDNAPVEQEVFEEFEGAFAKKIECPFCGNIWSSTMYRCKFCGKTKQDLLAKIEGIKEKENDKKKTLR